MESLPYRWKRDRFRVGGDPDLAAPANAVSEAVEVGPHPAVELDPYWVATCIRNLIDNATQHGAEPVEVQAFANWGTTGVDEEMVGTLRFAGGLLAQFSCGLTLERREFYQVAGPDGHIEVQSAFLPGTGDTTIQEYRGRGEKVAHAISGVDEYQLMVEHFGDCVLHQLPVRDPPAEAAASMRVIKALIRSARGNGCLESV